MTYREWYEKNIKGNPQAEAKVKIIKNRTKDQLQYEKYRKALGDNAPGSLELFQKIKYTDGNGYENLKEKVAAQKKIEEFLKQLHAGNINTNVKTVKQQEHIQGTKKWKQRVKSDLALKGTAPDMFYKNVDVQELVDHLAGTGTLKFHKGQQYPIEYVTGDAVIGKRFNLGTGKYEDTKRFAIRYSSKGVHLHPVKEV